MYSLIRAFFKRSCISFNDPVVGRFWSARSLAIAIRYAFLMVLADRIYTGMSLLVKDHGTHSWISICNRMDTMLSAEIALEIITIKKTINYNKPNTFSSYLTSS